MGQVSVVIQGDKREYHVEDRKHGNACVRPEGRGLYRCSCWHWNMDQNCPHIQAVRAYLERREVRPVAERWARNMASEMWAEYFGTNTPVDHDAFLFGAFCIQQEHERLRAEPSPDLVAELEEAKAELRAVRLALQAERAGQVAKGPQA